MGVHYDASWTNNRVHFVSPARGNNAARGGEGYSRRGTEREKRRFAPNLYTTGILSLSPTLAILSPPRCSFVDFSSGREKKKIVGRWKRERKREKPEPLDSKIVEKLEKGGGERSGANERKNWLWKVERNVGRSTYLLEWTKNGRLEEGKWWNRRWEGIDEFQSCPDNRLELFEQGSNGRDCLKEYFSLILQLWAVFLELLDNLGNNW